MSEDKDYSPINEEDKRQLRGDWSHYGRHKSEEYKLTEEYIEKLRSEKHNPIESTSASSPTPLETEDVFEKIRNFKSNLPTLADWKRKHRKNRKGKKGKHE